MTGLPASAPADRIAERMRDAIESFRPFMQADGCDIEFLGVKEGMAQVRLLGLGTGCAQAELSLQRVVERHLKELVPEIRGVVSICG